MKAGQNLVQVLLWVVIVSCHVLVLRTHLVPTILVLVCGTNELDVAIWLTTTIHVSNDAAGTLATMNYVNSFDDGVRFERVCHVLQVKPFQQNCLPHFVCSGCVIRSCNNVVPCWKCKQPDFVLSPRGFNKWFFQGCPRWGIVEKNTDRVSRRDDFCGTLVKSTEARYQNAV